MPGRLNVITGAPGTGKSIACLQFLNAALDRGEQAAILTHDDPTDLLAQGDFLGADLRAALADERLIVLRYQLDFARRFARAAAPELVCEELRHLLDDRIPSHFAIDSIAPFLEEGAASGVGISSLLQCLESLAATSLVTYPGDLAGNYDRRLEPLVQRAAVILHLTAERDGTGTIEIRKVRYQIPSTAPVPFRIKAGVGLAPVERAVVHDAPDAESHGDGRLLVLELCGSFPDDLLHLLRGSFEVVLKKGLVSAFSELARSNAGALLLDVTRENLGETLTLIRELRRARNATPIILLTQCTLRSDDRVRALHAGADEFLTAEVRPDELLVRLNMVVRRGPSIALPEGQRRSAEMTMDDRGRSSGVLNQAMFRREVQSRLVDAQGQLSALVTLSANEGSVDELSKIVISAMRADGGDLAGILDDRVMVLLHSVRRPDVSPFVARVRDAAARAHYGALSVDTLSYPADESRIRALLSLGLELVS